MTALIDLEAPDDLTPLEVKPLAHQLADAYWRALKAEAEERIGGLRHAFRDKQQLLEASPGSLEWHDLSHAEQIEPGTVYEVFNQMKQEARDELKSGQRAANVVGGGVMRPWIKARYLALRESFI